MKPEVRRPPELLAPAGHPEAGYAALHYGADAVYLGLKNFSARAEAVNFSPEELSRFVSYAHSLRPARKVYLAVNTLVREDELPTAAETLLIAAETGVDAVIVQDLGIAALARERFPSLELHASTQLAIHNLAGVREAARLGFDRVTMARELTLDELRHIAAEAPVEIETFIHGTLCYSYSGLCLFSSIIAGRSGNRGRCVYSCREAASTPVGRAHPFSLKDMALGPRVLDLVGAGVASLKIEGRKKSPLYVAATVDYYRRILDGTLDEKDAAAAEARLQTIFARPWTRFFLDSRHNPDAADAEVVGHRGARIGEVDRVVASPAGPALTFRPALGVERHDGLQVDIPGESRPYGFPVDDLFLVGKRGLKAAFAVPAGESAAVALPPDAPPLTRGLPVYLSSSQLVKRSYPFPLPAASETALAAFPATVRVTVERMGEGAVVVAEAEVPAPELFVRVNPAPLAERIRMELPAFPARDAEGASQAARASFARMGGSRFELAEWTFLNPAGLYVKPGDWNRLRRELLDRLEAAYQARRAVVSAFMSNSVLPDAAPRKNGAGDAAAPRWSVYLDSPEQLAGFGSDDLALADEVAIGMTPHADAELWLRRTLDAGVGEPLIILPPILRRSEYEALRPRVEALLRAGRSRWLVGNLGALSLFPDRGAVRLAADWPIYIGNTMAARSAFAMGFETVTASPECAARDLATVVGYAPERTRVLVYSELPLFISAACAHAHLGLCRTDGDGAVCGRSPQKRVMITMEKSGEVEVIPQGCGSVVVGKRPLYIGDCLDELNPIAVKMLCVDLRWRRHDPGAAAALWRQVRGGEFSGGTRGNFRRR